MVNHIWLGMIVVSIVIAFANGRLDEVTAAVFTGAADALTVTLGLVSVMVLWLGLMNVAERGGLLRLLARLLQPLVRRLFPDVPPTHPAFGSIVSNMSANVLGLGNAATPLGIRAMQQLQELNAGDKSVATPAMCTLLALNTASITLVPTTLIALRLHYGSAEPAAITGPTLLATAIATAVAIIADRIARRHVR